MTDNSANNHDQGSFMNGFVVGMVAGAMGYFLFATDRGEKVRTALLSELEEAKRKMAEGKEAGEPVSASIRALVKEAVEQVAEKVGLSSEPVETEKKKIAVKKKPTKAKLKD